MTTLRVRFIRLALVITAGVLSPIASYAQLPTINAATRDAALTAIQKEFAGRLAAASSDADRKVVYREMFEALIRNESLYPRLSAAEYRDAVIQDSARAYTGLVASVGDNLRESAVSPSVNPRFPIRRPTSWLNAAPRPS